MDARIFGTQVGQAVAKNAQAFIGNVGSAIGQSMMSDMVSEDYDLLEDTTLGEKFTRSLEPASLAGGVSLIFGGAGMAGAVAKRPGAAKPKAETAKPAAPKEEIKSFQELPPAEEIRFAPKAPPAPEGAVTEPFMPTVVVNGEPFTASSHAGAVVQAVKKHGKEATAKGDSGFLDDQGRFVSSRTNDIEDRLSAAIRDDLPPDEIAAIEKRLDQSRAQDEKVPLKEKAPEEKPAPAAKPAGFLKLDKPAIDQDFGPEWKNEVSNAYDEVKTGSSYITEVTGADMFKHFARDFPGENWRQDTATSCAGTSGSRGRSSPTRATSTRSTSRKSLQRSSRARKANLHSLFPSHPSDLPGHPVPEYRPHCRHLHPSLVQLRHPKVSVPRSCHFGRIPCCAGTLPTLRGRPKSS